MAQKVLHRGEEYGQARKLEMSEVLAFGLVSGAKAGAVAIAANAVIMAGRLLIGENVTLASIVLTTGGIGAVSFAVHLLGDLDTLVEGLRSFRTVETYAPSEPEPTQTPQIPIVVKPYGGDPYVLSGDKRLALSDGRQSNLGLNPPTLAAILQEVISQHDGQWSRRRLMSIKVSGERITRSLYEQITDTLTRAGLLQPKPQGGFSLPPDVANFEDVRRYLPDLPSGQAGGREGTHPSRAKKSPVARVRL